MNWAKEAVAAAWNWLKTTISNVVSGIIDWVKNTWSGLKDMLSGPIETARGIISGIFDKIKAIAQGAWDAIQSGVSAVSGFIKGILNAIIDGVNAVIGGINILINGANKLPGPDLPTISKIPHLAKGGIVGAIPGGTLAVVAEGGRPERIEPLDRDGLSKRDKAMLDKLNSGGVGEIRVFIGDTELTNLVRKVQIDQEVRVARQLMGGRVLA
jgi:phage-related protein